MKREIKFRAFDDGKMIFQKGALINLGRFFRVIREDAFIMQYTGLKDKNGVEIYEGDLFHLGDPKIIYEVIWHDSGFRGQQVGNLSKVGLEYWRVAIEVIGNIYETKTT
jgi:hypothetical protein